jgi:isopentenyl phosphate kinase
VCDCLIILKLGGSVITKKEAAEPTLDHKNLDRLSREISESSYDKLIIVHGAGSFGHPLAQKYGIGNEITSTSELARKKQGFSIIQNCVKNLNSKVCEYLRTYGVFPVSIQPSSFVLTKNKRIYSANIDLIGKYLDLGFVPVIYGDVVLDEDQSIKMAVLSGDQIIKYLAEHLKPERVILGSDVDGIYTKDPKKHSDAELVELITSQAQVDLMVESMTSKEAVDVTGGMEGKLRELLELADLGVKSEIINANRMNLIKEAINGNKIMGTLIKKGI